VVKKTYKHNKPAFTLIELIFAIVIIGISVISLPMMIQATSRGIENSIVQEAIFAASSELMGASAGYWDTNSMSDNAVSNLSRVIDINNSCVDNLRPGHIPQPLHRRCVDIAAPLVTPNDIPDGTFINLNNAAHGVQNIFTDTTTNQAGYKATYNSTVTVDRNNTAAATNNIKFIEIRITDATTNTLITVLRMQSANIGEIDFFKRRF
jgi:prepilin-type N-terminal cleavage/methylation domain-containing protein